MRNAQQRLDRLTELENLTLGRRLFKQSLDDPDVFHEFHEDGGQSKPCSQADITALGDSGWQCLVIRYVDASATV